MGESKQDVVVRLTKLGLHTREYIKEQADCTPGALASYFSAMRNAARFTGAALAPIEIQDPSDDEAKVMTVMTHAEVEAIKEERAANRGTAAAKKSPEERLEQAIKRLARSESAVDKFDDRVSEADGEVGEETQLRYDKAKIELRLAEIEIARCEGLVNTSDDVEEEAVVEEEELM